MLLAYVQIAMGCAALATVPLHSASFDLFAFVVREAPRTDGGYALFNLVRYGMASLIMVPAAFCAGMTLPLVTRILYAQKGQGEKAIGFAYSANTIGAISLMLHPDPRRVANIGFGSGITGETILGDPRVLHLDTIEIEPRMVDLARRFGDLNRSVYEDPRSAIRIEDAKSFFAANGKTYDLIASEPSNPSVSGVSGLFSVEFYRHVSRYLNEDGLFAQWLQTYETDADRAISVLKAVDQAFDDYMVFALVEGDVLIVAKPHGKLALHEDAYARLSPQTRRQLRRLDIANLSDITFRLVGNKAMFKPLLDARPVPANSDFVPYLDSHADRDRFLQKGWPDLHNLATTRFPIAETLGGRPPLATPSALSITTHFGSDPAWLPARLLKETLLGPAAGPDAIPIPANLPEELARQGNQVIELCNHPPRDDRPGAAAILGSVVLPFLSPAEGRDVLAALGRAACLDLLPGSQARAVWDQYARQALGNAPPELALQILRAHSLAAGGQPEQSK
jgi:spermidine synthase